MDFMSMLFEKNHLGKYRPSIGKFIAYGVVFVALFVWLPVSFDFEVLGISITKTGYQDIGQNHWLAFTTVMLYLLGKKGVRAYSIASGNGDHDPSVG